MSISADNTVEVARGNFHGWLIVIVAILMQTVVSGVAISSFSFWIPAWMDAYGVGRAHIMTTLTGALLVSALVGPFGGYLMDRWSVRGVACSGLLIFSIGATLLGFAHAFWQIQLLYAISFGLGLGLAGTPAAQTMTAKAFEQGRGAALSLVVVGLMLGGVVMPKVIASLLSSYDWRTVAWCISVGGVALIPIVGGVVRIHSRAAPSRIAATPASAEWTIRSILSTPRFWVLLIVFLPEYGAMMGYIANVAQFSAGWGLSASEAASYLSLTGIAAICVTPFVGRLADRFDPRYVLLAGYLLAGSGFLLAIGALGVVQIVAACLLIGAGTAFFYPMQGILVARQFGARSFGRALGLLNFFLLIGAAAGPGGGALRDKFGNYSYFFVLCALVPVLCSAALFLRTKSVRPPR
jgi:MFS family permease